MIKCIFISAVIFFLNSLSGAITTAAQSSPTSVKTDIQSQIKIALAEQDISLVRTLTPILSYTATSVAVFATVAGLAFVSILGFIIKELFTLRKERNLNEVAIKNITEHEGRIASILQQIESIKTDMRDAALAARTKIDSDAEYAEFIKTVMGRTPDTATVTLLKDLVWKENISLKQLEPVLSDKALLELIRTRHRNAFRETLDFSFMNQMSEEDLFRWAYEMKVKNKTIEELIEGKRLRKKIGQILASGYQTK